MVKPLFPRPAKGKYRRGPDGSRSYIPPKRWTDDRLLTICDMLDSGWKLSEIARQCQVRPETIRTVVRRFLPRRAQALDRKLRPEYYARREKLQQLDREAQAAQREKAYQDHQRAQTQVLDSDRINKLRDGAIRLWDQNSIR